MPRPNENIAIWYHELSKDTGMGGMARIPSDKSLWPKSWTKTEYKEYLNSEQIPLKDIKDLNSASKTLNEVLLKRRSGRNFESQNHFLTIEEISYICKYGFGEFVSGEKIKNNIKNIGRTHPSGGARYSLEYYIFINRSKDFKRGIYHYNIQNHALEFLIDYSHQENPKVFGYEWAEHAACYIFITSLFERNMRKYAERGYRYILLEAGHVGQSLYLLATNIGLKVTAITGTRDRGIEEILKVDGKHESLVYTILIG